MKNLIYCARMAKSTLMVLLAAILLVGCEKENMEELYAPDKYLNSVEIDGLNYKLYSTNVAEVTTSDVSGDIIIPPTVKYEGVKYKVKKIGEAAFYGCTGLTSITIPNSVTSIGDEAFYGCSRLKSVTIPNSVTSIGDRAFEDCTGLTSVTIPNSVTSIGNNAFEYCSSLTSVTIPSSVTSIGDGAFWHCTGLTSVTIPNSVTSIGRYAFWDCTGLTSVTIGNSVTSIGDEAFYGCTGLTSVTNLATTPQEIVSNVFYNISINTLPLYVPAESVERYKSAEVWKDFKSITPVQ